MTSIQVVPLFVLFIVEAIMQYSLRLVLVIDFVCPLRCDH